jgi:uncharacterized membrane protein
LSTYRHIVGSEEPVTVNELPANRALVEALVSRGVIDRHMRRDLFGLLYPRKSTEKIVLRSLLGLSAAFFLFGFSAILAANWNELGVMLRLGVPQLIFAASLAGAIYLGLDKFSGQLLAAVAAFSIGGVLIVLSQEFQLNADAPWLFGRWLLLALPIVLCARFLPLWISWICLLNLHATVFILKNAFNVDEFVFDAICWSMILFSITFVALRELLLKRNPDSPDWNWLRPGWSQALLLTWMQILAVIHFSFCYGIFLFDHLEIAAAITMLLDVVLLAGIHWWLRKATRFDMWALLVSTIGIGGQLTIMTVMTLVEIFDSSNWDWELLFLLGSISAFGIFFACTLYLRKLRDQQRSPTPGGDDYYASLSSDPVESDEEDS